MFGFLTCFDRFGNIVAECDASALDGDIVADTDHAIDDQGSRYSWEDLAEAL